MHRQHKQKSQRWQKASLPQWSSVCPKANTAYHHISRLRCNTHRTSVASQKTSHNDMQYALLSSLLAEPANVTWCLQQQTSQGKQDLLVCAAVAASSIAGIYRNQGVTRPMHHCELRIMAGRWYLLRSCRSVHR